MEGCEMIKPRHKRGFWKPEEDLMLRKYVEAHGEGNWTAVSKKSGLQRGAKSCRLRWKNYLRPNIKRGMMSEDEKDLIIRLHKLLGNRWSLIAGRIPGRTDNEIKNYWNTHLNKKPSRDQIKKQDSHTEGKQSTSQIRKEENAEAAMEVSAKEKEGDSSVQDCLKIVDYYGMNSMAPLPPVYSPVDNYLAFQDGLAFLEAFGNDTEQILLFQ